MGKVIVKDKEKNRYNLFSTIVDDYLFDRFSKKKKFIRAYKQLRREEFEDQLKRELKNGFIHLQEKSHVDELIAEINRKEDEIE